MVGEDASEEESLWCVKMSQGTVSIYSHEVTKLSFFHDNLILPLALQESLSVVLFYPCEIKSQTESKNLLHQRLHQNDIKRNTD